MLRASPMQKWKRGLLMASLAVLMVAGAGLATSAQAQTIVVGFNPTGGGIGGTTNFGTLQIATIDELPGNAIAVGFNQPSAASPTGFRAPAAGDTFTLVYQASVGNLNGPSGPIFGYGTSGNTGQLAVVASFTEVITSFNAATGTATFTTTGAGTFNAWFNPTRVENNLAGTGFAVGQVVYSGTALSGGPGSFASNSPNGTNAGPLDGFLANNYPGVNSVQGSGGSIVNVQTTSYDPAFFVTAPPPNMLITLTNTSNNLPFNQVDPSAVFFNGQIGVASVGPNNGGTNAAGNPLAANVMFQADANTSFSTVAAIPEPGTITTALTGIGFAFLASLRASRRRRDQTSAV